MIIKDNWHPYAKLGSCSINHVGIMNDLIGSYMGKNKFGEKGYKRLRLNVFLLFEYANEAMSYELNELEHRDFDEAYKYIVDIVERNTINVREIDLRFGETNTEKDARIFCLKITRELMKFFETLKTIMKNERIS